MVDVIGRTSYTFSEVQDKEGDGWGCLKTEAYKSLKLYALEGMCICALFSKGVVNRGWSTPTVESRGNC